MLESLKDEAVVSEDEGTEMGNSGCERQAMLVSVSPSKTRVLPVKDSELSLAVAVRRGQVRLKPEMVTAVKLNEH